MGYRDKFPGISQQAEKDRNEVKKQIKKMQKELNKHNLFQEVKIKKQGEHGKNDLYVVDLSGTERGGFNKRETSEFWPLIRMLFKKYKIAYSRISDKYNHDDIERYYVLNIYKYNTKTMIYSKNQR